MGTIDLTATIVCATHPTGSAILEIIAGQTCSPAILEIGIQIPNDSNGTIDAIGIGRPAAAGVSPKANTLFTKQPNLQSDVDTGSSFAIATDWQTPPTAPTNFLRRASHSGGGAGGTELPLVMRFPQGLVIAAGATMVVWMIAAVLSNNVQQESYMSFWINLVES